MGYPLLTKLVARSPRIVDLVFLAEPAGRWRRLALGGAVVLALYSGLFALVSRLGGSIRPWSAEMAARVHEAIAMERAVDVTLPPPAAPSPSAPAAEAPHIAISRSGRAPHTQPARSAVPAQAGQLAVVSPEPADFTGTAFIVGAGTSYSHLRPDLFSEKAFETVTVDLSKPAGNVVSLSRSCPNEFTTRTTQEDTAVEQLA